MSPDADAAGRAIASATVFLPVSTRRRAWTSWCLLLLLSGLALLVALAAGSVAVPLRDLVAHLSGLRSEAPQAAAILQLRIPRALAAYACGGLLALSGALMQVLMHNPLADPYVLGISGGAAVGALLAIAAGFGSPLTELAGMAGALCAVLLVFGPARRHWGAPVGSDGTTRVLLTGVVLASGWSALISLILTLAPDERLRGMLFWLIGDLGGVTRWQWPMLILIVLVVCAWMLASDLEVLLRGDAQAFALGVPTSRRRIQIYLLASLAAAVAVTTGGAIGFVGLLVPHALRLLIGNDQRVLLPASALLGGSLLACADTLARTVAAPVQLPVGVLTALLGVPGFLWLMGRERRR